MENLLDRYRAVRKRTLEICRPLHPEDYVLQPIVDVSPPKWHIGHTTWFFETFLLKPYLSDYREYNTDFNFIFNSYYESLGARIIRTDRGNLSRPSTDEIYSYRDYVDAEMAILLGTEQNFNQLGSLVELGLSHEEQHQELLLTDIKYILGHNPFLPHYNSYYPMQEKYTDQGFIEIPEGLYDIGYQGKSFCFDNELGRHKVYLQPFSISKTLVTNAEYLEFMNDGGYQDFKYWHSDGWEWVNANKIICPMYWHKQGNEWFNYTFSGLQLVEQEAPLAHVSYYEAWAFAAWKKMRLPTEFEWEAASNLFNWGQRWEWTESAYLPYPGFKKAEGAVGEYNGKFMVNQMVLRGASEATSPGHSRNTYRNFFKPDMRWQFTGIRLAK